MSAQNYPLPQPDEDDQRFNLGLLFDIGQVLVEHGFPKPSGADNVDLMLALHRFVFASESRPVPEVTAAQQSMMQRCEVHEGLDDEQLAALAAYDVHPAVTR